MGLAFAAALQGWGPPCRQLGDSRLEDGSSRGRHAEQSKRYRWRLDGRTGVPLESAHGVGVVQNNTKGWRAVARQLVARAMAARDCQRQVSARAGDQGRQLGVVAPGRD